MVPVSYRDYLPFVIGLIIISVKTTVSYSGSDVRTSVNPSYIGVLSSYGYTTFVGGTQHRYLIHNALRAIYDNGNIGLTYTEETVGSFFPVHYQGYKISSCSYPSQGSSEIVINILEF